MPDPTPDPTNGDAPRSFPTMLTLAPLLLTLACGDPGVPTETAPAAEAPAAVASAPVSDPATAEATPTDEPPQVQAGARAPDDDRPSKLPPPADDALHVDRGLIVGTWSVGDLGYDEQWVDEAGLREVFTMDLARRREWRGFTTGNESIPLDALLGDREGDAVAYAYSVVERNRPDTTWDPQEAVLHIAYRSRVQVRYDGELVVDAPTPPGGSTAVRRVPVTLTDAFDTILIKVGRGPTLGPSLDVSVHLSLPDGSPIPFTRVWPMRIPGLPREIPLRER